VVVVDVDATTGAPNVNAGVTGTAGVVETVVRLDA
jgi:hypothetical protein